MLNTYRLGFPSFNLPAIRSGWMVWGIAALFYGYQFMLRVSPGVMAEDLMRDFGVDACSLGLLSGCYYYAYASLQIPVGTLMDRLRPRRMMTIAAILCAFGTLIFSMSPNIFMAAVGRTFIGIGSAAAFLSCLKLGTLWFPSQKLPLVVGLTLLLGTLGAISASSPMAWLSDAMGWRNALGCVAIAGFIIAFVGWNIIRDYPSEDMKADHDAHNKDSKWYLPVLSVIRNPQSWLIALYGGMMYVPLSGFADLWGIPYIMHRHGISNASAGMAIALMYTGIGLGSPLFSVICNRFQGFKPAMQISALISLIFISAAIYLPTTSLTLTCALLFCGGLALGGQFLGFSMVCVINPPTASGTAGGFHNMMCMTSGVITQPFIGYLLDLVWNGIYKDGIPHYTASDFQVALSVVPICLLIAALTPFLMREVFPRTALES